jgi:uncharacterized protein
VSDLTINISRLSEGIHQYSFEAAPKDLSLDERFVKPVLVQAALEKTSRQMFLRCELRTTGLFTCDRCLTDFDQEVSAHFEIMYMTQEGNVRQENEEEVQFLNPDTNVLDLGEDVRQFLILSVRQKLLCREDCEGLCPKCGANRNKVRCDCTTNEIDPRWEVLRKMSSN